MTQRLYQTDSYLKEFEATVVQSEQGSGSVILDRSAFYPGGGGQPCDLGALSGLPVKAVRVRSGTIVHVVEGDVPSPDASVHGIINWDRRYKLMRTHTAMHVLCGVVFRDYGALVTGGEMDPLNARMDFEFARLERALVTEIQDSINAEVAAAREVRVRSLPRQEAFRIPDLIRTKINLLPPDIAEVRTVEIVGLDLQADGGTHVANTSEIGNIRIVDYKSKGAINKRIYVELGDG
ncbi:MAG TPA: alanyl-tRNA editing protein [Anaerolineales bacterium]|nr:alanyl-tRNA editing protein [Anaerolineales bacterium]